MKIFSSLAALLFLCPTLAFAGAPLIRLFRPSSEWNGKGEIKGLSFSVEEPRLEISREGSEVKIMAILDGALGPPERELLVNGQNLHRSKEGNFTAFIPISESKTDVKWTVVDTRGNVEEETTRLEFPTYARHLEEAKRQSTVRWLSFEAGETFATTAGSGYSLAPYFAYTPLIQGLIRPWLTLVPRLDFQLDKTPGGLAPIVGLSAESWIPFNRDFYAAPGLGAVLAFEGASTGIFPSVTSSVGYHLKIERRSLLSKLRRLIFRYHLLLSPATSHELEFGVGAEL